MAGPWHHSLAGDDSDGLSWATAYNTMEQCNTAASNGEEIYTDSPYAPASDIVFAQAQLLVRGFNPSQVNDGTVVVFDGESNRAIGFRFTGLDARAENIEYKNCTNRGIWFSAANGNVKNVTTRNNANQGLYCSSSYPTITNHSSIGDGVGVQLIGLGSAVSRSYYLNTVGTAILCTRKAPIEDNEVNGAGGNGIDTDTLGGVIKRNVVKDVDGVNIQCDGDSVVMENRIIVKAGATGLLTAAGMFVTRGDNGYFGPGTARTLNGVDIDLGGDTDMVAEGTESATDLSTDPDSTPAFVARNIGAVGSQPEGIVYVSPGLSPNTQSGGGGTTVIGGPSGDVGPFRRRAHTR